MATNTLYFCILLIIFVVDDSYEYRKLYTVNANSNSNAQFKILLNPPPNITSSVYIQKNTVLAKAKGTQWEAFGKHLTCRFSFSGNTFSGNINFILKNITADDAGRYEILFRSGNEIYNSTVKFLLITDVNITYAEDGSDAVLPLNINELYRFEDLFSPTGKLILHIFLDYIFNEKKEKYNITIHRVTENKELYLIVKNVNSDDEGVYAFYRMNSGAMLALYASPDKPVIVQETELVARGPLTLRCATKSNTVPTGFETIPMYRKWFVDDKRIENNTKYTITTSYLKVASVEKNDVGKRIQCQAEEITSSPSSLSAEFKINIKFPPLITLSPPNTSYTQSEGDKMNNVTCYADCLPECRITWITPTRDYIAGPILLFRTLSRGDHGSYSCIATNDEGQDVKTVFINVQYYVTVIEYKTNYTAGIVMIIIAILLIVGTICTVLFLKYRTAVFQTSKSGKNERLEMTDTTSTAPGRRVILTTSENNMPNVYENMFVTENQDGIDVYEGLKKEDMLADNAYEVVTPRE